MSLGPLRVLLVEDDELFRLGLQAKLQKESGIEVVAEAEDGETAIRMTDQYDLDIVLLDVGLPRIGGLEACRQIKQKHPHLPILVLTSHSERELINQLLEVGVQGYCLKGVTAEVLVLALRSVAAGASWWDQTATAEIYALATAKTSPGKSSPLTPREQEILRLIIAGKTTQEIAAAFHITPGTVRVHIHAVLQKLSVRDRTQAALLALQQGLIEPVSTDQS
ncbi:MAG TPA: response regulator transcription factor [Leptolyngbyaceae cyanobacterium]